MSFLQFVYFIAHSIQCARATLPHICENNQRNPVEATKKTRSKCASRSDKMDGTFIYVCSHLHKLFSFVLLFLISAERKFTYARNMVHEQWQIRQAKNWPFDAKDRNGNETKPRHTRISGDFDSSIRLVPLALRPRCN